MEKRVDQPLSIDSGESEGSWGSRESPVGDENFHLEMDENGIIGLGEELLWDVESPDLEEGPWSQAGKDLQEDLSELLGSDPLSASPEDLRHTLSLCDLEDTRSGNSVVEHLNGEEEEQSWAICGEQAESPPERDGHLEMSEDELDREGGHRGIGVWLDLTTLSGGEETVIKGGAALTVAHHEQWEDKYEDVSLQEINHSMWPSDVVVQPLCVVDEYNLLTRASIESQEPKALHPLASEDRKPVEGLRGERDLSLLPIPLPRKGKPGLHKAMPLQPPTPRMGTKAQVSPPQSYPSLCSPTQDSQGHRNPTEDPQKPSKGSPCLDGSRRGQLTHRLPDFSRVEPKVRFPKAVYKPPSSKRPVQGRGSAPEMPLVFKSPADIVREVLLSGPNGTPAGPPSLTGSCHPLHAALPQEFRSPQQAHALVQQLQEDYNRLLTKYAEAENTIDRLRLEAKVNLYADPPRPSKHVCSGTISTSSKVMNLTFPQAQRAEFRLTAEPLPPAGFSPEQVGAGHNIPSSETTSLSRTLIPQEGGQLDHVLCRQAGHFQSQLDSFEDLLRRVKLKPSDLIKNLSDLAQGQEALETGYLEARDAHRLRQQQGNESGPFDPDRELEGQIFRSGMRLEELRERVGHGSSEQLPSTALSSPRNGGDPTPLPESPVSPVEGGTVNREVSSVSGESNGEAGVEPEGEDLPTTLLLPLQLKQKHMEHDFNTLLDQYQIVKELPQVLDLGQGLMITDCRAAHTALPSTNGVDVKHNCAKSVERDQSVHQIPLQESVEALPDGKPAPTSRKQLKNSSEEPLPNSSRPSGIARVKLHSSSLTSLGESSSSERQAFKLHHSHGRAPPVDGIVSPETDSGFMGSESSHLTPAVHIPFHQRATVRPSDPLAEKGAKSHQSSTEPLSVSVPIPTQSQRDTVDLNEHPPSWGQTGSCSGLALRSPSPTSSPQHWARSVTSETATCSVSEGEDGRDIGFPHVTSKKLFQQWSPSPSSSGACIDSFKSREHGQLPRQREAIQSLQAEVGRLRASLESSLRHTVTSTIQAGVPHARRTSLHSRSTQHYGDNGQREDTEQEEKGLGLRRVEQPGPVLHGRSISISPRRPEYSMTPDNERALTPTCCLAQGVRRQTRTAFVTHKGYSARPEHNVMLPSEDAETNPPENESQLCPEPQHYPPGKGVPRGSTMSPDAHPHSQHCPLCRGLGQVHRADVNDEPVEWDSKTQRVTPHRGQPKNTSHSGSGGWFMKMPPPPAVLNSLPVVQCIPVCPSVLYYGIPVLKATPSYPQSVYRPLGSSREDTRVRTREGSRHAHRSHSADAALLGRSLSQAIEVATDMKITSQRMFSTSLETEDESSQQWRFLYHQVQIQCIWAEIRRRYVAHPLFEGSERSV